MEKIFSSKIEAKEKIKEKFSDLFVFTTTFYKNDEVSMVRSMLAEEFFNKTENLGIRCIVVDGGSCSEFLDKISHHKNIQLIIDPSLKMGESRRRALDIAMKAVPQQIDAPFFLWTEPEKDDLIKEKSLDDMISVLRSGDADIAVPERRSKESYPKFQKWIESRANKRAKELFNHSKGDDSFDNVFDLWFGPKMFNREGAKYFLNYKGNLDKWDSIIKPVVDAYNDGKKIVSVPVDFKYPEFQRDQEEGNDDMERKRIEQYKKILSELGDDYWLNNK